MKLLIFIQLSRNETCGKVRIGEHLILSFSYYSGKRSCFIVIALSVDLECAIRKVQ